MSSFFSSHLKPVSINNWTTHHLPELLRWLLIVESYSGGGLAAVLSMKASLMEPPVELIGQILVLPVIDNTAGFSLPIDGESTNSPSSSLATDPWIVNQHAPFLTPRRMLWYRKKYLPDPSRSAEWMASPNFAPKELLLKSPPTIIAIGDCDLLAEEAQRFGALLSSEGVRCEVKQYAGATHSTLILAG